MSFPGGINDQALQNPDLPQMSDANGLSPAPLNRFHDRAAGCWAMTEYICATGKPAMMAPILQVDEDWYGPEQLFEGEELAVHFLQDILP